MMRQVLPLLLVIAASCSSATNEEGSPEPPSTPSLRASRMTNRKVRVASEDTLTVHEREPRIIGGSITAANEYPFFVRIDVNNSPFCGGVLMAPDIVVTAGHCKHVGMTVVVNGYDTAYPGSNPNHHPSTILWNTRHSGFNASTFENDIMVLKLANPAHHLQYVLPNFDDYFPRMGDDLVVMGLGRTTEEGPVVDILRHVTVQAIDDQTCASKYKQGGITFPKSIMLCAGSYNGERDACMGDSGGPLIDRYNRVVGLSSWAVGCGRIEFPGVYTRISGYHNWLMDNLCSLSDFPPAWCPGQEVQQVSQPLPVAPKPTPAPVATSKPSFRPTAIPTPNPTPSPEPEPTPFPTQDLAQQQQQVVSAANDEHCGDKQGTFQFGRQRVDMTCASLRAKSSTRQALICARSTPAWDMCRKTCGRCGRNVGVYNDARESVVRRRQNRRSNYRWTG